MGKQSNGRLMSYLPLVLATTFVVVVVPMLVVLWLRESGTVTSVWLALLAGVVMSLATSQLAAVAWKTWSDSDLLFSELMVWGWVQRWRNERRLAAATTLLGLAPGRPEAISGGNLTSAQKERLLTQLTSSLESNDPYTHGHSRRVARHAATIAKRMGLPREEVAKVRAAGAMHDVGKLETPTTILHKAGKLEEDEFEVVKRHPVDGATMVATLEDDQLVALVRHHHERLDGTGYPDGLAGDAIPLGARILAVADTFDAITSTRPYRGANTHKKALDILSAEAGTQLDPDAVNAFQACYSGRKPLAFWAVLVNSRPRLESVLGGGFSQAGASNVLTTAAAAVAVGAVAAGPGASALASSSHPSKSGKDAAISSKPASDSSSLRTAPSARALTKRSAEARARKGSRDEKAKSASHRDGSSPSGSKTTGDRGGARNPTSAPTGTKGRETQGGPAGSPVGAAPEPAAQGGGDAARPPSGNAYGQSPGTGQGNANAYGKSPGTGQGKGNAYGQGPGTGQGNGNAYGNGHSGSGNSGKGSSGSSSNSGGGKSGKGTSSG